MRLKGHTKLEINNKVVFEKDNDITEWVSKALHEGDYGGLFPETWKMPLSQWFSGCILTRGTNTNTLATMCLDSGFEITAQASDGDYSGTNTKRGRKSSATGAVANGYKFVWEWNGNEGNGDIASVCLTRANNGGLRFGDTYTEIANDNDVKSVIEIAAGWTPSTYTADTDIQDITNAINVIDYENEVGYAVTLADTTHVSIKGYALNTKLLHLDGVNGCAVSATPIVDETITLDSSAVNVNVSVSFTGDEMHLFIIDGTSTITDYVVDTSDWTYTKEVHDFSNDNLTFLTGMSDAVILKDAIPVKINEGAGTFYAWALASDEKYYKLDMVNDIALRSYNNPLAGLPNVSVLQGSSLTLPNGDFITSYAPQYAIYFNYAADTMKAVTNNSVGAYRNLSLNGNEYGTLIDHLQTAGLAVGTCFPYVSTVNNLQSLATKNAGDQMRLTYTITEVYPQEIE